MSDYPHHCGATQAEVERLRDETAALRADLARAKEWIAETCGFCGREVHAALKPMCGDCAGKEDPSTAALRADLAKAKEEIERLRKRLEEAHAPECSGCGAPVESFTVVCAACSR